MKHLLTILLVGLCATFLSAQTEITLPDTITTSGHYLITPADGTIQIDTTGSGFLRAALWIAGQDTDSYNKLVPGVDDVGVDGQGATLIGYGSDSKTATEFGIWFQNDERALDPSLQDSSLRDTVVNVTINNFWYGIAFRQVADGVIDNCTMDSTQKGIELMSTARNVRNKITNNVITNTLDKAISVRGSYNLIEDNSMTNTTMVYGKYGIQIDRDYSQGNMIYNNTITGGSQAGLRFNKAHSNTTNSNVISLAERGIYISGSEATNAHDNILQSDQISDCNNGLHLIYTHDDMGTDLSLSNNVIGLLAQNAVDEVFTNLTISNSDSLDISVENSSRIFVQGSTFDIAKVNVQTGSALFTGDMNEVTITSTVDGLATPFAQVTIFNQSNDTLGIFTSDSEGQLVINLSDMGITESNSGSAAANQNPWTFDSNVQLNGDALSGSVTATITSDTSMTVELSTENESLLTFLPDTLTESGSYYLVPDAAYLIDTTGVGFLRAALWVAGQDTDSYNKLIPGVDDVFIDGKGATIVGYGSDSKAATEFGIWFQNDERALDPALQDSSLRDTVVNVNLQNIWYGVAFRQVAEGLIDNCTMDSTQKGIELMSTSRNVRNKITNNVITNTLDKAISVRGSENLIENNSMTNSTKEYGKYGIQIDRDYSQGNMIYTNTITGGSQAGIRFNKAHTNITNGNTINNAVRGIWISGSEASNAHDNLVQNDQITNCDYGIDLIYARDDMITGATLSENHVGVMASAANGTVFENTTITSSDSLDVIAENGTVLFLDNCDFDTSKVDVHEGSVVYVSKRNDVDITVTLNGQALTSAADVTVTNADGDTMAVLLTDTTGISKVAVGEWAILSDTPVGTVEAQNPFTFEAILDDGSNEVSVAVTSDTSVTIDIIVDAIDGELGNLPKTYALQQNFPNPFNPVTTIKYQLPKTSDVMLKIYNVLGQSVITLLNERQEAGYKSVIWNGMNEAGAKVSTGIYFYVMEAGNFRSIKKMMLLK